MRKERLPIPDEYKLDQIMSYGRKAPEGLESMPVHVFIRMARHALRMTQAQLAKRAGIPQSHLAVIETGKRDFKLATLRKIYSALGGDLMLVGRFRKTPDSLVAERIREVARQKIMRVAGAGARESPLPEGAMTKKLIKAEEDRLRREVSSKIWAESPGGASVVRDAMPLRIVAKEGERDELTFWLGKSPAERVAAVEFLREQYYALSGYKSLPRLSHAIQLRSHQG